MASSSATKGQQKERRMKRSRKITTHQEMSIEAEAITEMFYVKFIII